MASKKTKKTPSEQLIIAIVVAIIGLCGTTIAAFIGYLSVKLQIEKPIYATQTAQSVIAATTQQTSPTTDSGSEATTPTLSTTSSQLDVIVNWRPCSTRGFILPENIIPEQNSYSTLSKYPDFNDWISAPFPLDTDIEDMKLGKLMYSWVVIGNNGGWVEIDNKISIKMDLVSSIVDEHVNLVNPASGCGGGNSENFSSVILNQEKSSVNQVIVSTDSDFFSIPSGEADVFQIGFICASPGIYQASAVLSVQNATSLEQKNITGFGKIYCPKSYTFWAAPMDEPWSTEPLINLGEYQWNGNSYTKNP